MKLLELQRRKPIEDWASFTGEPYGPDEPSIKVRTEVQNPIQVRIAFFVRFEAEMAVLSERHNIKQRWLQKLERLMTLLWACLVTYIMPVWAFPGLLGYSWFEILLSPFITLSMFAIAYLISYKIFPNRKSELLY